MSDFRNRYSEEELRRVNEQIQEKYGDELKQHRNAQPGVQRARPLKRQLPSERQAERDRRGRSQAGSKKMDKGASAREQGGGLYQEVHGSRGIFSRLHMALYLYTRGVLHPGSRRFNRRLEGKLHNRYFAALEGLHDTIDQLTGPHSEYADRLMSRLSQDNILYADLVYELLALSDYQSRDTITSTLHDYPDEPVHGLKRPFLQLYRDLLFLRPNRTALDNTLSRLFLHYGLMSGNEELAAVQHREASRDLGIIINELIPRLHYLFCFFADEVFPMDDPRIEMKLDDMLFTVLQDDFDQVLDDIPDRVPMNKPAGGENREALPGEPGPVPPTAGGKTAGDENEAASESATDKPHQEKSHDQEPAFTTMRRMFQEFIDHHSWLLSSRAQFSLSVKERVNYLLDEASRLDVFLRRFDDEARALEDMDLPSPSSMLYVNLAKRYDTLKKQLVLEEQKLRRNLDSLGRKMKNEVDNLVQSGGSLVQNGDEVIKAESPLLNGITVNQALENLQHFLKNFIYLVTFGELPGDDEPSSQDKKPVHGVGDPQDSPAESAGDEKPTDLSEEEKQALVQEKRNQIDQHMEAREEEHERELSQRKKAHEETIQQARSEAQHLKETSRDDKLKEIEDRIAELKEEAQRDLEAMRKKAREEMKAEKARMIKELNQYQVRLEEQQETFRQEQEKYSTGSMPQAARVRDQQVARKAVYREEEERHLTRVNQFEKMLIGFTNQLMDVKLGPGWSGRFRNDFPNVFAKMEKRNREEEHRDVSFTMVDLMSLGEKFKLMIMDVPWRTCFQEVFGNLAENTKESKKRLVMYGDEIIAMRNDLHHPKQEHSPLIISKGSTALDVLEDAIKRFKHRKP